MFFSKVLLENLAFFTTVLHSYLYRRKNRIQNYDEFIYNLCNLFFFAFLHDFNLNYLWD